RCSARRRQRAAPSPPAFASPPPIAASSPASSSARGWGREQVPEHVEVVCEDLRRNKPEQAPSIATSRADLVKAGCLRTKRLTAQRSLHIGVGTGAPADAGRLP